MPTKIGPFEILSELSKSPTGTVYKANNTESGQTVALKAIQLSVFGESAAALEQALVKEAEAAKVLSSSNITPVSSPGVIDGQFCAAMEYIQGNSIGTMLARKEGFSIWDLLDIGRQLGSGLDHAKSHSIVHYSLEPAKIMCGWDGTVKILGYGVSSVGNFLRVVPDGVSSILYYMSPEQVCGEACDARSNLFSLGAMLYEMVTERKAFDGGDADSLRQAIQESTPVAPIQVNAKVHPLLSDLIMKALAKDPAERYQSGRELLDDLEKCKESKPAAAAKKAEAPKPAAAAPKPVPVAPAKPVAQGPKPAAPKPAAPAATPSVPVPARPAAQAAPAEVKSKLAQPVSKLATPKAAAAAAGAGSDPFATPFAGASPEPASATAPSYEGTTELSASMSAAVADEPQIDEPQVETFEPADSGPKIAVDPMMAEGGQKSGGGSVSFSEMTELPPLKEIYVAPPPPQPPVEQTYVPTSTTSRYSGGKKKDDEKPKIQPREVAEKAIKEIKGVPPKLMFYAIGGAVALIAIIGIGVALYVHSLNSDADAGAEQAAAVTQAPAEPHAVQSTPQEQPAPVKHAAEPAETQPAPEPEAAEEQPAAVSKGRSPRKKAAPAPVIPGGLAVDSMPQGAQVSVDGQTDPSWVTPFALTNLQPGAHSITTSKTGYASDTRTINVVSANRATTTVRLAQLMATLIVKSEPAGASIFVDGRDVGTKTPAQVSVDKGQHVVLVRMAGYLDETMNGQFTLGQTFNFTPTLRSLGNTENIKTVGKFKLFGGKGSQTQGTVSIQTHPKGAQIAINQHMLDKNSPVDVLVDPGTYVVDITLSGYAPVHKVITADKGGKVVIDETMQQQ